MIPGKFAKKIKEKLCIGFCLLIVFTIFHVLIFLVLLIFFKILKIHRFPVIFFTLLNVLMCFELS